MQPDTLRALAAWHSYTTSGDIRDALLRPEISRAWGRAKSFRVNPGLRAAPRLPAERTREIVETHESLVSAARPYLQCLSRAASPITHVAILAAPDGTVLDQVAPAHETPEFVQGSQLGESAAGVNGVGTSLAEGTYVIVSGPEHLARGFHAHTCHGVPLRGPDGAVMGAVCLASGDPAAAARLRRLVAISARAIEAEVRSHLLQATFSRLRGEHSRAAQSIALLHQDIVQSQTAARLQIELGAKRLADGLGDALLEDADSSLESFTRSAGVWRLAGNNSQPSQDASRFAEDAVHLLQVEARTLRVQLTASLPNDPRAVWPPVTSLMARLVIAQLQEVMRLAAMTQGRVVLRVAPDTGLFVEMQSTSARLSTSRLIPFGAG